MRIQGYIFGETSEPVRAKVTLVNVPTDEKQTLEVDPGQKYTIDADPADLADLVAIFSAAGYATNEVSVSDLSGAEDTNIHLGKSVPVGMGILAVAGIGLALVTLKAKKKKRVSGLADVTPVLLIGGGLIAINMVSRLFDKLGLGGDPTRPDQSDPNSPWKPAFYKNFTVYTYAITLDQADGYAETIHDAFGVFQDDFNSIMSVFSQLRTKSNVSFLSDVFTRKYSEDLLSFLTDGGGILPWDGLSKDHLNTLLAYVNNLPNN